MHTAYTSEPEAIQCCKNKLENGTLLIGTSGDGPLEIELPPREEDSCHRV